MASERLTIVIKLGTSSIVDENTHEPILSILTLIVETAAKLHRDGHNVVLVSSGAIGVGLRRMDIEERPKNLPRVQALAAVGQCRLMSLWDGLFAHLRLPVAQILLTRNDIADEIKFGDNDTLSAITAAMVKADYLFLMTDVDCLYTANPRSNPDAKPIEVVSDISSLEADVSSAGSALGTGGMSTKIIAAKLGTSAGVTTIITKSSKPGNVHEIVRYLQQIDEDKRGTTTDSSQPRIVPPLHTRFLPSDNPVQSRSFWLLHGLKPRGTIYIDNGAYNALLNKASLLPAGVVEVDGHFAQQEAVRLVVVQKLSPDSLNGDFLHHGQEPREVGRALVNYGSPEIARIKGHRSTQINSILGYADSEYVALRENISFFAGEESPQR
ncbi:glutamate 5-kinase [Aspergillus terreus NIH2624]|uniref:Glutamate 5-kinase n=1 Tax=Aspergillus terreus (strain NIH 2624 / FGSC A1156) TaxID=341663 RepID=Q0CHH7_ASPTN|nr:glutamate 5-kinase [Aspergillus terreus NIH2624]EAU32249.1 glutamate 5-kinase [Aspergillus terreus NIH2624]